MTLTLTSIIKEFPDVTSFQFTPQAPFTWLAGQYIKIVLPHDHPDDRGEERSFTIASAPNEGVVRITTRFAAERSSTFKQALAALQLGATINASEPLGDFVMTDTSKRYVFVAGGIGITPFRAMLLDLINKHQLPGVTLLYGNRDQHQVIYRHELEALAQAHPEIHLNYLFEPDRISQPTLIPYASAALNGELLFYLSGPLPMVQEYENILLGMNVPQEGLRRDYIPGYVWF